MPRVPSEPPFDPYDPRRMRDDGEGGPYDPNARTYDDRRDRRPYDREEVVVTRRRPPLWLILAGLVALVLIILFAVNLVRGGPGQDRLDEGNSASASSEPGNSTAAADPAARCATRQTYDQVKAELFRQASATRGNDQAVFDRLSGYATLRMENPVLKRQDEGLGTLVCSGRTSIDLPPGLVVAGGRNSLTADLDYALQNAADGSGQVVTLAGADAITVPLATLARAGAAQPADTNAVEPSSAPEATLPSPPVVPDGPPTPQPIPAPRAETPPPAPTPERASSSPAFNCRYARTRGEIAVCSDDGLALLDRRMTSVYVDALRQGTPEQDALLRRTRDRFLGYRDRCTDNGCIAGAYRDRIREISDIMAGRWQP